jgi:hypothetical protein
MPAVAGESRPRISSINLGGSHDLPIAQSYSRKNKSNPNLPLDLLSCCAKWDCPPDNPTQSKHPYPRSQDLSAKILTFRWSQPRSGERMHSLP